MSADVFHRNIHIHLISDSTGETVSTVSRAALSQFSLITTTEHNTALVRTPRQLDRALEGIRKHGGVVFYTLGDAELRSRMETECKGLEVTLISILDPILDNLAKAFGEEPAASRPGIQHQMDEQYFRRIRAMEFTLAHDDGQHADTMHKADVILVGVSRTSKTPTSVYLANQGVRVGNIPLVSGLDLPAWLLDGSSDSFVVALTASPDRLVQLRYSRRTSIGENNVTTYTDRNQVREEVVTARQLYERQGWPMIDVSQKSIEETAAAVMNQFSRRKTAS